MNVLKDIKVRKAISGVCIDSYLKDNGVDTSWMSVFARTFVKLLGRDGYFYPEDGDYYKLAMLITKEAKKQLTFDQIMEDLNTLSTVRTFITFYQGTSKRVPKGRLTVEELQDQLLGTQIMLVDNAMNLLVYRYNKSIAANKISNQMVKEYYVEGDSCTAIVNNFSGGYKGNGILYTIQPERRNEWELLKSIA